jgi:hypothetical protein
MSINKVAKQNGFTTWTIEINGAIVGLLVKDTSSRTAQPWKAYKGIGESATMVGYTFESRDIAIAMVVA